MRRYLAAAVLLCAPLVPQSAAACAPPYVAPTPLPPVPPAPPQRQPGESTAAFAARGEALVAAHRRAHAEWEAEHIVQPRLARERAAAEAKTAWIKLQDDNWARADSVLLAKIVKIGSKRGTPMVIYRAFQRLKGPERLKGGGRLSTIRYAAPPPPCSGENPGLRGGKDARYVVFVSRGGPDRLRVLPLSEVDSPLLLAAVAGAGRQ